MSDYIRSTAGAGGLGRRRAGFGLESREMTDWWRDLQQARVIDSPMGDGELDWIMDWASGEEATPATSPVATISSRIPALSLRRLTGSANVPTGGTKPSPDWSALDTGFSPGGLTPDQAVDVVEDTVRSSVDLDTQRPGLPSWAIPVGIGVGVLTLLGIGMVVMKKM